MKDGRLTVVVGLPGAGKSKLVAEMRPSISGICVEDFHANAIGDSSLVEDSRHFKDLIEAMRAGRDCVIADIAFCDPCRRSNLEMAVAAQLRLPRIEWIYFENAPDRCRRNIQRRNRPSLVADLEALEKFATRYLIPEGVTPRTTVVQISFSRLRDAQ